MKRYNYKIRGVYDFTTPDGQKVYGESLIISTNSMDYFLRKLEPLTKQYKNVEFFDLQGQPVNDMFTEILKNQLFN